MKNQYESDFLSTIKEFWVGIAATLAIVVVGVAAFMFWNSRTQTNDAGAFVRDSNFTVGSDDAKAKVIYFEDYECPFCAQNEENVQSLKAELPEDAQFVYRHLPLDSLHPLAPAAARAVQAAGYQGKYLEMGSIIFANQTQLSTDNLELWAGQIGLDVDQWNNDRNGSKVREEVQLDLDDLESFNLTSETSVDGSSKRSGQPGSGTPTTIIVVDGEVRWWSTGGWGSSELISNQLEEFLGTEE